MQIKLVADSSSNLFSLPGVDYSCVPLKIITQEREYPDIPELDVAGMVEDLKKVKGTTSTSCPNLHDWSQAFSGADAAIAVTITSNLSGAWASAVQAAQEHGSVHVIDTLSTGPEMQLILELLRDRIQAGDSFEDLCAQANEYKKRTHLLFSLESLTNLARNGRVSGAVAKIAGVLGIRVVGKASNQGTLEPLHKCRGERKALAALREEMRLGGYAGGKVRIAHCFNLPAAQALEAMLLQDFPTADIALLPCTALCSYYAEQGGLLVGYEGREK